MNKYLASIIGIALLAAPALASADTQNDQLTALYSQLAQLLEQELLLLQPVPPTFSVIPSSGTVPLAATFTISNATRTEAIDFGDGHSSGSNGCTLNMLGFCDLSRPISHTYSYPGTYTATLYRHVGKKAVAVQTLSVQVTR